MKGLLLVDWLRRWPNINAKLVRLLVGEVLFHKSILPLIRELAREGEGTV